jgi:hypothetical protein
MLTYKGPMVYGVTVQMTDVEACILPEDGPEIESKYVVGKNKHY